MNRYVLLIGMCCCLVQVPSLRGQSDQVGIIEARVDSVFDVIRRTPIGEPRVRSMFSLYWIGVEVHPLLTLDTYNRLLDIALRDKDRIAESIAWGFAGQGYRLTGNYVKGLECHHKALALAEESGNDATIAVALNQMGHIYKDREEFDSALRIYLRALEHARRSHLAEAEIWPMMNLGAVYLAKSQLDSSLYYSREAYARSQANHTWVYEFYLLTNIGSAYSRMGEQGPAYSSFQKAIQSANRSGSSRSRYLANLSLAEHYQRSGQIDSCLHYARRSLHAVHNTVQSYLGLKPAKLLTDVYLDMQADSAIKYLKIYTVAYDSLYSTRANQQLQMMTFEEEQRRQAQAREELVIKNQMRTRALMVILIVSAIIALLLYRNNRQKQKSNRALQRQKESLEQTLAQLSDTQAQLIQSEKMASLGELTAGIAHEIKNPLNFVNNFAEVSRELLDELNAETDEVQKAELIALLQGNLQKINEHGKRADAIVKSMLQHSREDAGQKEPTDLNALVDEYTRLAYHGLRAKDSAFTAQITSQPDSAIPRIDIVPQDMGRVLLNLINNALQAVAEKRKTAGSAYVPSVTVSTGLEGDNVVVRIADNGPGIPASIAGKIFQPFFTTKPAGQGTGLGLSLSYDIVKAHGGVLAVENNPMEGATFTLTLPVTS